MRLGCRGEEGEATKGGVEEGGREQGQEEERLGTSWGAQMEQVKRWNNGRVRIEGAVSGEADTRKAGDKEGGSSGAGSRARSQVKSGCTHLFPPPPPGPEGPSHPQPTGGGLMPTPHFLSSAAWDPLHPVEGELG